jgi:hypothetical protein
MEALKHFMFDNKQDTSKVGNILDARVTKKTVVTLGTMQAGKTTHLGGLGKTAQYKASDSVNSGNRFRVFIREGEANIMEDIAELSSGHFPEATTVKTATTIKPAFTFEWEDPTWTGARIRRQADMPVIDFAGEQLVQLITQVKGAKTLEQGMAIQGTDQLTNTVNQCSALLIIINAIRAEGLPIFKPDPYDKIKGLSKHPDVNTARMISPIIEYKHNNKGYSPPLERIGIVITACDMLFPIAKTIENFTGRKFDPLPENGDIQTSQQSLSDFMKAFFPQTHALIASLNVDVQYFPSYFELEKDGQGNIQYWDPESKKQPKIKRGNIFDSPDWVHNVNRPKYTEYWFNQEIEWLKEFATQVKQ